MLGKIKTFNDLVDLIVLQEGYFHVPKKVYQHIIDDYFEILKTLKSQNIKRMKIGSFPLKAYDLDFSGTNFEFLNHLDPNNPDNKLFLNWKPSVIIKYTLSGGSWFASIPPDDFMMQARYAVGRKEGRRYNGFIQIDISDGNIRQVVDIIEHEISHYVQYLIKIRKKLSDIGGLPPKEIIDDRYDSYGYKKGDKKILKSKARRTKHAYRPIEYYPDLLSSIRQMEYSFSRYYPEYQYDSKKPTKWEKEKKQFFLNVINDKIDVPIATPVFKDFKKISKEFYNHIVKVGYDAFVNKPPNLDMIEIRRIGSEIGIDTSNLPKEDLEKANTPQQPKDPSQEYNFQEIKTNDRKMFEDSLGKDIEGLHYSDFDRGRYGQQIDPNEFSPPNIENIVGSIAWIYWDHAMNSKKAKLSIQLPSKQDEIEGLFTELKRLKDSNEYIFGKSYWRSDELKKKNEVVDTQKAYQSLYNYFVNMYLKKGKPNEYTKKTFLEFLEKLNF